MAGSIQTQVARLDERLNSIDRSMTAVLEEMKAASESRKKVYESQEATGREIIHIHHRLDAVEKSVDAIRPTTEEYKLVRNNVVFAGRLGQTLWSVGKALLSAAAGAAAAWYALTGRPPP